MKQSAAEGPIPGGMSVGIGITSGQGKGAYRRMACNTLDPTGDVMTTPADELHKLNDLKEKGALSAEEFDRAKAKLLA